MGNKKKISSKPTKKAYGPNAKHMNEIIRKRKIENIDGESIHKAKRARLVGNAENNNHTVSSSENYDITFQSFPKDAKKLNIWLSNIKLKGKMYKSAKICSNHFKPEDYDPEKPGHLLDSAVPFFAAQSRDCDTTVSLVENDMENYLKYKLVGGNLILKKGVVPHRFACQKQSAEKPERSVVKKLKIAKLLTSSSECIASTSHDNMFQQIPESRVNNEESTLDDPLTEPTRKSITYSRKNRQKKDTQNVACSQIGNTQAVTGSQIGNSHAITGFEIGDTQDVTRSIKSDIKDEEDHGMESQEYGLDEAGSPGSGVTAVCAGCLSGDRKCAPVGSLLEVMVKLLDLTEDDQAPATTALLCWECVASLTRARRFIQRARRAQGELRRYASDPLSIGWDNTVIEPQSSLSKVTITDFDMTIVAEDPDVTMDDDYQGGGRDDDDEIKVKEEEEEEGSDVREVTEPGPMVQEITLQPERYTRHMRVIPAKGRSGGGAGGSRGCQGALACAPCDVDFTTPAELNKHRAQEHRDKSEAPYICSICKDNFTKDELNAHMQQHMFVFYCEVCRRDFLTEKRFRVHYARGHAQIFECGYCRVPFACQSLLARHCLSLHYKYCCAHCGRQYMARDQLERHMRIHR